MELTSVENRRYFDEFRSQMGCRQIVAHLTSVPTWWKLRSSRGETPLMHALKTRGMTPDLLSKLLEEKEVAKSLVALDNGGRNLWAHLFYHRSYRPDTQLWVPVIAEKLPLQSSPVSGRGIFIDQIKPLLKKQWNNFFPTGEFSRKVYALAGNTYDTWWSCPENEAEEVANWLLGVQRIRSANQASLVDNLRACERNQPGGLNNLPGPLQGALRLLQLLRASNREEGWKELADSRLVHMKNRTRDRVEGQLRALNGRGREYGLAFLRDHDQLVLQKAAPQPQANTPRRRL